MAEQFYGLTDVGKHRKNNEDTFIAQAGTNGHFIVTCVIDGVGGYAGGEVAAALAREAILQRLEKPSGEVIPMLIDCFNLANERILHNKAQPSAHDRMACVATLALADIEHNRFYYAHVGDTRLYLFRDGSLIKISHDQSFVGFLEDSGRLTEAEAMTHPKRNEISKALGFEVNLAKDGDYIETGQSPFLPGDMLLLCSDGLTDMIGKSTITDVLNNSSSLKDKCTALITAANNNGGNDNITVVLVQNNKASIHHDAVTPTASSKKNFEPKPDEANGPGITPHLPEPVIISKSNTALVSVLTLLLLVFIGLSLWLYFQGKQQPAVVIKRPDSIATVKPNAAELKIQQLIDSLKGSMLVLSDTVFKSPVMLSRAININRDTLIIKAKGHIELKKQQGYNGPAFSLGSACRAVLLDSLNIRGFKIGIVTYGPSLLLRNMRFVNCEVAVQYNFLSTDNKYASGSIAKPVFVTDSVPLKQKLK